MWLWLWGAAFCVGIVNVYIFDSALTLYFRENSYLFLYALIVLVWVIGDKVIRQLNEIIEKLSDFSADGKWETGTARYQPAYEGDADSTTNGKSNSSAHWFTDIMYSTAILIIIGLLIVLVVPKFIQG